MTGESDEVEVLQQAAIVAGEACVRLDEREVRGVYIHEKQIGARTGPRLHCRLHGHDEPEKETLLDHQQKPVGVAEYCPHCLMVLDKEVIENAR